MQFIWFSPFIIGLTICLWVMLRFCYLFVSIMANLVHHWHLGIAFIIFVFPRFIAIILTLNLLIIAWGASLHRFVLIAHPLQQWKAFHHFRQKDRQLILFIHLNHLPTHIFIIHSRLTLHRELSFHLYQTYTP